MTEFTGVSAIATDAHEALGQAPTSQLARAISHDLRNALLVIRAYSTILMSSIVNPESRQDLEEIDKAVDRAAQLADRLLALQPADGE